MSSACWGDFWALALVAKLAGIINFEEINWVTAEAIKNRPGSLSKVNRLKKLIAGMAIVSAFVRSKYKNRVLIAVILSGRGVYKISLSFAIMSPLALKT